MSDRKYKIAFIFIILSIITIICLEFIKIFSGFHFLLGILCIQVILSIIAGALCLIYFKNSPKYLIILSCACILFIYPCIPKLNFNNSFKFVLHAGGGDNGYNYLNSKEIFTDYANKGIEYIELDFLYTSDNYIIASHNFEHYDEFNFDNRPSLEEFEENLIFGRYSGITYDWLIEELRLYPDIKIVFDTKEKYPFKLLTDMVDIAKEKNFDIFSRFIVQVYSIENYYDVTNNFDFDRIWFTNYKVLYSPLEIINYFGDKEDVDVIVLHYFLWWQLSLTNFDLKKDIAVHTVNDPKFIKYLSYNNVDYIYVDYISE